MVDFIQDNPQFIVNGFIKAGILGAIDGVPEDEIQSVEEHDDSDESDFEPDDELQYQSIELSDDD